MQSDATSRFPDYLRIFSKCKVLYFDQLELRLMSCISLGHIFFLIPRRPSLSLLTQHCASVFLSRASPVKAGNT